MKIVSHEYAQLIEQAINAAQAAGDLPEFPLPTIEIRPPKNPEQGDYACAVAMQLAKPTKLNPFDIATKIANHLPKSDYSGAVEVVKPGFINFRLSESWLRAQTEQIIVEGEKVFQLDTAAGKQAQVEFVSANPTGPLHVGRSRGAIVGDTMARLLEAYGYTVEREYYFNNAGMQMQNLGNSLRIRYLEALGLPAEKPEENFYQGEYLVEFAQELVAEKGNSLVKEDWQPFKEYAEKKMFAAIRATLERVNIHHDVFFNENTVYENGGVWDVLNKLEAGGHIYESNVREQAEDDEREKEKNRAPAKWFRSTTFGDKEDRIVVKADGNPTYVLPDIAYHLDKLARGFDLLVNILGSDHIIEHQVVKYGIKALGQNPSPIRVVILQLVRAVRINPETGERMEIKKMSTRKGDYDTLDDLIDQTSPDVVRYLLLARSTDSGLDFDLDLAVKQSNENPVYYIQNAYVRCAGIFREAATRGVSDEGADVNLLGEAELQFLRKALQLGEVIDIASTTLEPHRIAFYAHELAGIFHPIYEEVRALHGEVPADVQKARLRFYRAAQVILKRVLTLMGMSAPEVM